jgi:hypothetical protein
MEKESHRTRKNTNLESSLEQKIRLKPKSINFILFVFFPAIYL